MRSPRPSNGRQGFSLLELAVVLVILLVALLIFSGTVSGMARQRTLNRENTLALEAARNTLETLRSEPFAEVFALYNDSALDDPGGPGTGPGSRFAVDGLRPVDGAPGGLQGEILFPTVDDPVDGLQLREDVEWRDLGMPRDLSGDGKVDARDHSGSYFLLPVQIRVRWQGRTGPREFELTSQLCHLNKT